MCGLYLRQFSNIYTLDTCLYFGNTPSSHVCAVFQNFLALSPLECSRLQKIRHSTLPIVCIRQICALVALYCTFRICVVCYKQNCAEFVVQKINEVSLSCFAGFGPGQRLLAQPCPAPSVISYT